MKTTLRTLYALIILSVMFVLAITPFNPVEAATAGQSIAAGQRAMSHLDAERVAWLRTLDPKDQQIVLCVSLAVADDGLGMEALDCYTVNDHLTKAKTYALESSYNRYRALFGRVLPTANDMALAAPQDRHAIAEAIWCRQVRDKIAAQIYLMKSGSTGYWNLQSLQSAEMGVCHENMDLSQL